MRGRNNLTNMRSCFFGDTGLGGDFRCRLYPGVGINLIEYAGGLTGSQCVDACLMMKKWVP